MRKLPKQARARDTLEIIFEATTQLLERDGRVGLSTNAIAERAGISIGTLYHYFPSKEAILVATARREMAAHRAAVTRALTDSSTEGHAEPERHVLRALLGASDKRTKARRIATETLIAQDLSHEIAQPVREAAELLKANSERILGGARPLSAAALFVLTRAVSGVVNAAVREDSPLLGTSGLEDELVHLVHAFLKTGEQAPR